MLRIAFLCLVLPFVVVAVCGGGVLADTTFTGATNNDWHTATNWTAGVPDAADLATIQSGKTCNISANAEADRLTLESTATLNIQAAKVLTLDGTGGGSVSTINGTVNLEGSGSELEFTTNAQSLQTTGSGKIVGKHDAAIIDINISSATPVLTNQITIEGKLKVTGQTLDNRGTIKANRYGTLWINCDKIQDVSSAVWRTDTSVDPEFQPSGPTLRMNTTRANATWNLIGAFVTVEGTVVDTDTGFCCSGGLTSTGTSFIGDANARFKNSCP